MNKSVVYQGKALAYQAFGFGHTVVLLHGFGEDGNIWRNQIDFLKSAFHLIIPHVPGSGNSDLIEDMSMDGLAESIHFVLQQEHIQKCTVIGHSMGGYITLAFAEKYLSLLDGFGLFHSTAFADSEEKKASRKQGILRIQENGALPFLNDFIPGLYAQSTKTDRPALIKEHLKQASSFTGAALTSYYAAMMERPDRTNVLKQNKLPILFVLGKEDVAIPLQDTLKLASMPDISYIHVLEKSGHMGMVEEPEKANSILNNFLLKTI